MRTVEKIFIEDVVPALRSARLQLFMKEALSTFNFITGFSPPDEIVGGNMSCPTVFYDLLYIKNRSRSRRGCGLVENMPEGRSSQN
jgi:hypothetical protein